jgi:type IV pilus assembly protein PilN
MPRINLLPHRQRERAKRTRQMAMAAAGAAVFALVTMLIVAFIVNTAIEGQRARNVLLNKEIAELDRQITEILGLEAQKSRLQARLDIIERLQRSRSEVVHVVDQLARTLPDGVYLTSVKQTDKRIELKGIAQSSTRVSTFMRNIESSQWLSDPSLQVIETGKSDKAGAEFTLLAAQRVQAGDEDKGGRRATPGRPVAAGAAGGRP